MDSDVFGIQCVYSVCSHHVATLAVHLSSCAVVCERLQQNRYATNSQESIHGYITVLFWLGRDPHVLMFTEIDLDFSGLKTTHESSISKQSNTI